MNNILPIFKKKDSVDAQTKLNIATVFNTTEQVKAAPNNANLQYNCSHKRLKEFEEIFKDQADDHDPQTTIMTGQTDDHPNLYIHYHLSHFFQQYLSSLPQPINQYYIHNHQMQQVIFLLQEVKLYLSEYPTHNSASLLSKVDHQIKTLCHDTMITLDSSILLPPQSKHYHSQKLNNPKCTFKDMFLIEFNFISSNYYVLPYSNKTDCTVQINNDRLALLNLLIGNKQSHVKPIQKTQSMTQLHRLTSNMPSCKPVLILPNYSGGQQQSLSEIQTKYFYIYEESSCVQSKGVYYLVDRYYIFCTEGLAYNTVSMFSREVRKQIFTSRILSVDNPENVNSQIVEGCLIKTLQKIHGDFKNKKMKFNRVQPIENVPILEISQKEIKYKTSFFQSSKLCRLAILLFYCAISDRKLVLLVSKSYKHSLSEAILSLQLCLKPMKFVFPVVFASLTDQHLEYLESPVPLFIGLWGPDKNKPKSDLSISKKLSESNVSTDSRLKIDEIIIDLDKLSVIGNCNLGTQETYILQKLNNFICKYGRGSTIEKKMENLLFDIIFSQEGQEKKSQSDWIQMLRNRLYGSQIYQVYMHR